MPIESTSSAILLSERRVCVTGADGFLGAHLVAALISAGAAVQAIIRPGRGLRRLDKGFVASTQTPPHPTIDAADVSDERALRVLFERFEPEWLFHIAAKGGYRGARERSDIFRTNVGGAHAVLEASAGSSISRVVVTGGSSEYGSKANALQENDRVEPISYYAATKAASTLLFEQAARSGRHIVVLRPFSIFGPAESPERLIPSAVRAALEGRPLPLTTLPFARDFVFVEDVAQACILAADNSAARGETINVGTGIETTNHDVVDRIEAIAGLPIERQLGAYAPHPTDSIRWVADVTKARTTLGFEAHHDLDAGLRKTVAWFRDNEAWR